MRGTPTQPALEVDSLEQWLGVAGLGDEADPSSLGSDQRALDGTRVHQKPEGASRRLAAVESQEVDAHGVRPRSVGHPR